MKLQKMLFAADTMAALRPRRAAGAALAERVRACLTRVVSHPGAIEVSIEEPRQIVLRGAVLAWEHDSLLRAVAGTGGVARVRDELAVHESADQIGTPPAAPGYRRRGSGRSPQRWSAGVRLLAVLAGGGGLLMGARRRGAWGAVGAAAGGALLLRSLVNVPLRELAGGRSQRLELRRSLHVAAPLARVFAALRDCERFPLLMRQLREVHHRADGSSHWVVAGPGGLPIEWDALITQVEVERLLAWRTLEASPVQHWGMLRFEPADAGQTRLHLYLSYQLPAGRLGQAISRFLDVDRDGGLAEDLARLPMRLEQAAMQTVPTAGATPAADRGAALTAGRQGVD